MATPVLDNNTPAPANISWGPFVIKYEGEDYAVPAASTDDRWVWWRYNAGAPLIEAGASVPTDLTDDDLVLFANKAGIGVRIQSSNLIDGELIVQGSIFAEALSAHIIDSDHITVDGLDAGVIKFGEMSGERIAAHTITAEQIEAHTITALELAAHTITAEEIEAHTITAEEIEAHTITATEIEAHTITAEEIEAHTITAEEVSADIIVANEIYAQDGYFGSLKAEQISSGSINADLALITGLLSIGEIRIDPLVGISVPGPAGLTLLSATGVGHRFAGQIDTDKLTVNGGLTLNAVNNQINGQLSLTNVVLPPTQAPSAQRYWPYSTPIQPDTLSLAETTDNNSWLAVWWGGTPKSIRQFSKTTGLLQNTWSPPAPWSVYNVAKVGNWYYMICWHGTLNQWWLCRVSSAWGSFSAQYPIANVSDVPAAPGVGPDLRGTGNIIVVHPHTDGTHMRVISVDQTGTLVTNNLWNTPDWNIAGGMSYGCGIGPVGPSGEDQLWAIFGSQIRMFDLTSRNITWWPGRAEAIKGMCIDYTGKPRYLGYNTYRIYEWVKEANWSGGQISIGYAWYDNQTAGSGKHETTLSPLLQFQDPWRWAAIQVDMPAPSNTGTTDSPNALALYFDGARAPELGTGVTTAIVRATPTGVAPKATNEFVSAAAFPGSIRSAANFPTGGLPRLLMKGDGTGNWGDLVVDGNGKAVIGGDSGWINVTGFTLGWENFTANPGYYPAQYRKIGNRVWLRGLIVAPAGGTGTMFTLPVGFRPTLRSVQAAPVAGYVKTFASTGDGQKATTNPVTGSVANHTHNVTYNITTPLNISQLAMRVDVLVDGTVSFQDAAGSGAAVPWVSLDTISFWVD